MGRKKLPEDVIRKKVTFKLKPEHIQLLHDEAELKNVKIIRVVEDCLNFLKK